MYRMQSAAILAGLVGIFSVLAYSILGTNVALVVIFAGLLFNVFGRRGAARLILRFHRARSLSEWEAPDLVRISRDLSSRAGITPPHLALYPAAVPNAFAICLKRDENVVAVSTGLLQSLDLREVRERARSRDRSPEEPRQPSQPVRRPFRTGHLRDLERVWTDAPALFPHRIAGRVIRERRTTYTARCGFSICCVHLAGRAHENARTTRRPRCRAPDGRSKRSGVSTLQTGAVQSLSEGPLPTVPLHLHIRMGERVRVAPLAPVNRGACKESYGDRKEHGQTSGSGCGVLREENRGLIAMDFPISLSTHIRAFELVENHGFAGGVSDLASRQARSHGSIRST